MSKVPELEVIKLEDIKQKDIVKITCSEDKKTIEIIVVTAVEVVQEDGAEKQENSTKKQEDNVKNQQDTAKKEQKSPDTKK